MIYFVNVRDTKSGYLVDDFCCEFEASEYGSVAAALAAANVYFEACVSDFADYEVKLLAFS